MIIPGFRFAAAMAGIKKAGVWDLALMAAEEPVAAAALFVDGNVGWTGLAGTLPSHRQRGAQTALLSQRIRDGVTMGCQWFVSECEEETVDHPNPAYHNLLRNGFKLAYVRPNYVENA